MTHFCSTNNNFKKKVKNTSTIFYGPTHINITICSDDSSSYSLIMTLVLYIMTEAGSDSLITKVNEAMAI